MATKVVSPEPSTEDIRRELDLLYGRRQAVEDAIRILELYAQHQMQTVRHQKRKVS